MQVLVQPQAQANSCLLPLAFHHALFLQMCVRAAPAGVPAREHPRAFLVGATVKAHWRQGIHRHQAQVLDVRMLPNGALLYDVRYRDGLEEQGVPEKFVHSYKGSERNSTGAARTPAPMHSTLAPGSQRGCSLRWQCAARGQAPSSVPPYVCMPCPVHKQLKATAMKTSVGPRVWRSQHPVRARGATPLALQAPLHTRAHGGNYPAQSRAKGKVGPCQRTPVLRS